MATGNQDKAGSWALLPYEADSAEMLLYCFPYAGGGTWIYREWVRRLAPQLAVCPVKLPGRGDRFCDAPATELRPLAKSVAAAVADQIDRPFAAFGHSLGAILAFEFVRELASVHGKHPDHLIASAAPAPCRFIATDPIHGLPDKAFLEAVRNRYGHEHIDQVDPRLLELLLPSLRGDIQMYENYVYEPCDRFAWPIAVMFGPDDPIPCGNPHAWGEHTTEAVRVTPFPGGHFYIHDSEESVMDTVRGHLLGGE